MSYNRILRTIACFFAAGALALAQFPEPAPGHPSARSADVPNPAPLPQPFANEQYQAAVDAMREAAVNIQIANKINISADIQARVQEQLAFAKQFTLAPQIRKMQSDDRLYETGLRALDSRRWDEALEAFNQVVSRGGSRADGGLYWKAYTLNRLARRDEALATLAELHKAYASSHWLDDSKALELQIKQESGRPVSPESESDEDLKLLAINGIMQSDPDRAVPLLENILKGSNPPKIKERALYVLAQSNLPRAQQILEQIARGGANPDLQLKAINFLFSMRRRQGGINQNLMAEIYASSNDFSVKRAILSAYMSTRDTEHLTQIAKTEKTPELREFAFQGLASSTGQPELWQIYQAETSPDVKQSILRCMYQNGNVEKLTEVVHNEKDPKVRRAAIEVLASQKGANTGDTLVSLYSSEQDPQVKQLIVDHLSSARDAKNLVGLARAEKDQKMKLRMVERLSNMKSKEASDYLMELLSK